MDKIFSLITSLILPAAGRIVGKSFETSALRRFVAELSRHRRALLWAGGAFFVGAVLVIASLMGGAAVAVISTDPSIAPRTIRRFLAILSFFFVGGLVAMLRARTVAIRRMDRILHSLELAPSLRSAPLAASIGFMKGFTTTLFRRRKNRPARISHRRSEAALLGEHDPSFTTTP